MIAHAILGQEERSQEVESKCGSHFILNVSLLVFHSDWGTKEAVFPVSGSFMF